MKKKVKGSWGRPVATESKVDIITNLPDCITSNILSRLLAKEAMRTSILSRDWKHKWTSIYNVDIEIESDNEARFASFYSFVDRVLDSNPDLELTRFSLDLGNGTHASHHLERWIYKVLGRGVKELQIVAPYTLCQIALERPTSLTVLKLLLGCTLIIRTENCFPGLKSLFLGGSRRCIRQCIRIMNDQSPNMGGLSLSFPVLEQLQFDAYQFADVKFATFNAPKPTFKAAFSCNFSYAIKILAPVLRKFQSDCSMFDTFVLYAPSLYSATLVNHKYVSSEVLASRASVPLLQTAPGLKSLELSCTIMEALATWKEVHGFPTFDRLIELQLHGSDTKGSMDLLQLTPSLKSLTLDACCYIHWVIQEPLPCCIVNKLKYVHIREFTGKMFQFDLASWFLENAKKLKTVYLYPHCNDLKDAEISRWMWILGPKSSCCVKVLRK